eukprot:TRINITY_DN6172_c0_g1_i6.p2 TRINITY_DN6172_c0_g1~~TRINITY_DN6172_c0_g1_i6.p2  ORF type:complete len:392 (+),score=48.83 TRINITY_DN6172_c0_g1_i6:1118-2293(+)
MQFRQFKPEECLVDRMGYAKLGYKQAVIFELLVNDYAKDQLVKFSSLDVSNLIWACGKAGFQSQSFRTEFEALVCADKWNFEQQQLVQVLAALVDLGWHEDCTIIKLTKMLKQKVRIIESHLLPLTVAAISHLDIRDKKLLSDLSAQCVIYAARFSSRQMSKMSIAFAKMNHYDHALFDAIVHESMQKVHDFETSGFVDIVWALAQMEHTYNSQHLYNLISRHLGKVCSPISIENMYDLIQAFKKLNIRDLSELNSVFIQYISNYLSYELSSREVVMLTYVINNSKNEIESQEEMIPELIKQILLNVKLMNYTELDGLLEGLKNFSQILDSENGLLVKENVVDRLKQLRQELTKTQISNLFDYFRQFGWLGEDLDNFFQEIKIQKESVMAS